MWRGEGKKVQETQQEAYNRECQQDQKVKATIIAFLNEKGHQICKCGLVFVPTERSRKDWKWTTSLYPIETMVPDELEATYCRFCLPKAKEDRAAIVWASAHPDQAAECMKKHTKGK